MNRTLPIFNMHLRDKFTWYFMPYAIMGGSFIVNLIISIFLETPLFTGGLASIFIYYLVVGILTVPQTFQFSLGLGTTRKDYFIGTLLACLVFSAINALILVAVGVIENATGAWGTDLHFFQAAYVSNGTYFEDYLIYFIVLLLMFMTGFLISSFFRRFGSKSMLLSFLISIIVFTVLGYFIQQNNWWVNIFNWFIGKTALDLALWTLPFTVICILLSYVLLRRSTV